MSRDTAFTLFLLVVVGAAVWGARDWTDRAQLFPWIIGFPLLGLIVVQLALSMRRGGTGAQFPAQRDSDAADGTVERAKVALIAAWLLGFATAVWLFGFPMGGTLATFAYLKGKARERWPITLAITAGTAAFFLLTSRALHIPYPPGLLFELVRI